MFGELSGSAPNLVYSTSAVGMDIFSFGLFGFLQIRARVRGWPKIDRYENTRTQRSGVEPSTLSIRPGD